MIMLILSVILVPVCAGDKILQVMLIAAVVLFWSLTYRFIGRPVVLPVNIFINTVLVAVPPLFPFFELGTGYFVAMLPLACGLTALTSMNPDKRSAYERPDAVNEILIPSAAGFGIGVAACSIYIITGRKTVSIAIILAALLLMVVSVLFRRLSGREVMFSSPFINDIRDIPSDDRANLRSFFVHRGIAAISAVVLEAALLGSLKIPQIYPFTQFDPKPFVCALAALLLSLVFLKKIREKSFGGGFYPYELIFSFGILIIPFLMKDPVIRTIAVPLSPVLYILADMLITGFLCTYKRRRLSAVRHYYSEGAPLLLMTLGLLVMAVEVFAHLMI